MTQTEIIKNIEITSNRINNLKETIEQSIKELKESQTIHYVLLSEMKKIRGKEFIQVIGEVTDQDPIEVHNDFVNYKKLMEQKMINKYTLTLMGVL